VFVRLDPSLRRWRSINGIIGILRILTDGDSPRRVPSQIIDEIVACEDKTGVIKPAPPIFAPGQAARLIAGPLADVTGLFEETRDEKRIILLLSLLGRKVRIVAPVAEVTAAA
jgi:transcriptional antiterminator RfaH